MSNAKRRAELENTEKWLWLWLIWLNFPSDWHINPFLIWHPYKQNNIMCQCLPQTLQILVWVPVRQLWLSLGNRKSTVVSSSRFRVRFTQSPPPTTDHCLLPRSRWTRVRIPTLLPLPSWICHLNVFFCFFFLGGLHWRHPQYSDFSPDISFAWVPWRIYSVVASTA